MFFAQGRVFAAGSQRRTAPICLGSRTAWFSLGRRTPPFSLFSPVFPQRSLLTRLKVLAVAHSRLIWMVLCTSPVYVVTFSGVLLFRRVHCIRLFMVADHSARLVSFSCGPACCFSYLVLCCASLSSRLLRYVLCMDYIPACVVSCRWYGSSAFVFSLGLPCTAGTYALPFLFCLSFAVLTFSLRSALYTLFSDFIVSFTSFLFSLPML